MKKSKEVIREERKFIRLCSQSYKDMIHKRKKMTMEDFNIICHGILMLELNEYYIYFLGLFQDFVVKHTFADEKQEELDAMFEDMGHNWETYYVDMFEVEELSRKFWEQMPLESQKKKYRELFVNDTYTF